MKNLSLAGLTFIAVAMLAESVFAACINNDTEYEVYASFTLGGKATTARIPPGLQVCGDNVEGQFESLFLTVYRLTWQELKSIKTAALKLLTSFLLLLIKTVKKR